MSTIGPMFRVFLSSTFGDFRAERTALHPLWHEIQTYCRERGARFQIIDLRWGITEEASLDQRTIAICLEEIYRCQQMSPAFSFIALLGDRHGSRLLPEMVPAPDFARLLDRLTPDERNRLASWYRLDHNALPAGAYVLLPRGGPQAVAHGAYAAFDAWQAVQRDLLESLTRACQQAEVSPTTRASILASVTEREVQAGIFDAPDGGAGALCFRRTLECADGETISPGYGEPSPLGRSRLDEMYAKLAAGHGSVIPFTARYRGDDVTGEHLPSFVALVKAQVLTRIDAVLSQQQVTGTSESSAIHNRFAAERLRHFSGRAPELARVAAYLQHPAETPLLVTGPGGVGKTAFMLRALADVTASLPASAVVLHRFIGGSVPATTVAALLRDLMATLAERYGAPGRTIPSTRSELIQQWPAYLALATAERPLILFLDAIDQLHDAQTDLSWLPATVPPFVHLVVSVLDGPLARAWKAAHATVPIVHLAPLDASAIETMITGRLQDVARTLQPGQARYLVRQCAATGLPLYARLAVDAARHWRSWQVGDDLPALAEDVFGVLYQRFDQLEAPAAHGQMVVQHALGLIGAAKDGLAEDELLDLLGHDAEVMADIRRRSPYAPRVPDFPVVLWARLFADLETVFTDREQDGAALITFYHRQVGDVVLARYLGGTAGIARHTELARYFEAQPVGSALGVANLRKLGEQPTQEALAHRADALHAVLTDVSFLEAQLRRAGVVGVEADVQLAPNDHIVRQIGNAVRAGTDVLEIDPEELYNQIHGRTGLGAALHASLPRVTPRLELRFPTLLSADAALVHVMVGHTNIVSHCAFSPDGRQALSASQDRTLRLWDVASGGTLRVFTGHTHLITWCAFSPDGRQVLSASWDKTLRLWDVATGETVRVFEGHSGFVTGCAYSPDGRQVLSASEDKTLRLWDVATGETVHIFTGHTGHVNACAFSPNGRQALSAASDGTLRLWDLASGETMRVFVGHPPSVFGAAHIFACAFSPDGRQALSASWYDSTLRLWDVTTGETVRIFAGHTGDVKGFTFSPDGRQVLSTAADKTLRLWDVASGEIVRVFTGHTLAVSGFTFSPDGRQALSASEDRTLRLWDVASGETLHVFAGHTDVVTKCAFSPDGQQVLSASSDKTLRLWVAASRAGRQFPAESAGHASYVMWCAFSPDGRQVISASMDNTLRLWDVAGGEILRVFTGHTGYVNACACSPDGRQALSASDDKTLRLWDVASGATVRVFVGHSGNVSRCAFSPDGRQALSASWDKTLRLWDVATGETVRVFEGHSGAVSACAFSPNGRQALSVSSDETLRLWDVASGETLWVVPTGAIPSKVRLGGSVRGCAFSPDGRQVLSASEDGTLRLWDVATSKTMRVFAGHAREVTGCVFSPDGRQMLSASFDKTLRLWDVASGRELCHWTADSELNCCAFSSDGSTVSAGGERGRLHFLALVAK